MRWSIGLIALCASASAQPALVWHAPPGCPDEAALRAAIAQRLDVPVERVELAAEIEVTASGAGFVAHVTTHGEAGETRELAAASCAELTDAVAVVVARIAAAAPKPPAPAIVPIPRIVASPPPSPRPPPRALPRWNGGARIGIASGTGATPDLGLAGELAAWGSLYDVGLELAIERWVGTTADFGAGNGVEVGLVATSLRAGWFPRTLPVRAWLAGELGTQRGTGFGFAMASGGKGRWAAAGAGASFAVHLAPHLAAIAAGEVMLAVDRVTFTLDAATVYRSPAVAIRGRLGVEISWR